MPSRDVNLATSSLTSLRVIYILQFQGNAKPELSSFRTSMQIGQTMHRMFTPIGARGSGFFYSFYLYYRDKNLDTYM